MQQVINISTPDDGLGDALRNGFDKTNQNFDELYAGKVDKITGKGLSENDFTDTDKAKLDGIETGAQVNVNADFGETDNLAPGYILNKPPSLYASVGYFDHNDTATHTTPLVLVSGVNKKLTNNALGAFTSLGEAPYLVSDIWNATTNQFDFSQLSIGDTLDLRVDTLLTTTGTNKTYKILLRLGIGTASEYYTLVGSGELKAAVTDENIVKDISFYIGSEDIRTSPAELYIVVDTTGSVKVNGWYTRILRKNLNLVTIIADASNFGLLDVSPTTTGSYIIDWHADTFDLTLTGNTTLFDINLPMPGTTKVISLYVTGSFTLTFPSGWSTNVIGAYDGSVLNQIVVEYISTGKYFVMINQPD